MLHWLALACHYAVRSAGRHHGGAVSASFQYYPAPPYKATKAQSGNFPSLAFGGARFFPRDRIEYVELR